VKISSEFATSELDPVYLKIIAMFAVEHILNEYNNLKFASQHANTTTSIIRQYMLKSHHHLFNYLSYSHACAAVATMAGALATFSWNFMDLFIAITSIALAEQFRLLNRHLENVRGKVTLFYMIEPELTLLHNFSLIRLFRPALLQFLEFNAYSLPPDLSQTLMAHYIRDRSSLLYDTVENVVN
jgi:hypothetical protein